MGVAKGQWSVVKGQWSVVKEQWVWLRGNGVGLRGNGVGLDADIRQAQSEFCENLICTQNVSTSKAFMGSLLLWHLQLQSYLNSQ